MKETFIAITLLLTGCVSNAERVVRIVETGVGGGYLVGGGEVHGIRVETSAEPPTGRLIIDYMSDDGVSLHYDSAVAP